MNKFQQNIPQVQAPPPQSYSDRSFLHEIKAGVLVPLWQSVVTGSMIGLILSILLGMLDVRLLLAAKWGLIIAITTTTIMWLGLQRRWWNLTKLENFLGVELDGIPNNQPSVVQYTVNTFSQEGHMTGQHQYTFTATPEQIRTFCHKTRKMNFPVSRRPWVEQGTFTDDNWRSFYRELVTQKLITANKGRNVLTTEGEQWADGVISEDDPHYSPAEDVAPTSGK